MEDTLGEATEQATVPEPLPSELAPESTTSLAVLHPFLAREPRADLTEAEARSLWAALSAPWHPALLGRWGRLPRLEPIESPQPPGPGEIRVLPAWARGALVSGYRTTAADVGCRLIEAEDDRPDLVRTLLEALAPSPAGPSLPGDPLPDLTDDFLALGTAHAALLSVAGLMGHTDVLDHATLEREVLPGAAAWLRGDATAARNRLRAGFEILTQAREKFFPIDSYLVDFTLLAPENPPESLEPLLATRVPVSLLATGAAIEQLATRHPDLLQRLVAAVNDGWVDVVGGPYEEREESLLPLESVVWLYARGAEAYRRHLDERTVETLGRRRFGFYPLLPQLARRFGMRYGLPLSFDGGRFPVPRESKRIWESPDGSSLESLTRVPLGADRWVAGARFASRLAWSMKNDHVATVPLMHWPEPVAGWYEDLRRVASYSPVFGRWVTASDFFHLSDRPWEVLRPQLDAFGSPYLEQAVAVGDRRPISHLVERADARAQLDVVLSLDALGRVFEALADPTTALPPRSPGPDAADAVLEPPRIAAEELESRIEGEPRAEPGAVASGEVEAELRHVAAGLVAAMDSGAGPPAGWLVFNTLSCSRKVPVVLRPDQIDALAPAQRLTPGADGEPPPRLVDLPASGFVWIGHDDTGAPASGVPCEADAETRVLRSSRFEVAFDPVSGGLKGIRRPGEPNWRLGVQLVALGLRDAQGNPVASVMAARAFQVEAASGAFVQAVSRGEILDPARPVPPLARFELRVRLWEGRGTLDMEVGLSDIDGDWLETLARLGADPWSTGLACRWAWPDANAVLRRSSHLGLETTTADRPETSEVFEIVSRPHHTALLLGGLSYHHRRGARMLDTLLVVGAEIERRFRLGVALDLENPTAAAIERLSPPVAVPASAPPRGATAGWFLNLDQRNVQITRVRFSDGTYDGRGWGLVVHLLETAGKASRCRLRVFINPLWARQVDFQEELVVDLATEDDAVKIDLTPREFAAVEITLGLHDNGGRLEGQ